MIKLIIHTQDEVVVDMVEDQEEEEDMAVDMVEDMEEEEDTKSNSKSTLSLNTYKLQSKSKSIPQIYN